MNANDSVAAAATPAEPGTPVPSAKADRRAVPTPDEAREWLKKHLARAPERSEDWCREVLAIYRAGRRPVAEQAEEHVP